MSRPQDLQRVDSFQWPKGHVGQLSESQARSLDEFKQLCQDKGYFTPGDSTSGTRATHDDETMLRYLRARKFVPNDAFNQFKDTEDWRKENDIDNLYETIDINEYEFSRRLYPQWTGRRDKRGIPFFVYEIGSLNYKDITANANDKNRPKNAIPMVSKAPRRLLNLFALYESLTRFSLPICSAMSDRENKATPISQSNNIVDISNVGLTTFWNLKNHMQDASKLATAHYPETLDRIFIVGAPSFFPTVWGWIKKWFDPITVSKIFILSPSITASTLEQYLDKDNIPKKYGGNLDWSFGDLPNIDPAIADRFEWHEEILQKGHRSLPIGPLRFEYNEKNDLVLYAVGSENGVKRNLKLGTVHPEEGVAMLDVGISRGKTAGVDVPASAGAASSISKPEPSTANANNTTTATNDPAAVIAGGTADIPFHHPEVRTGTSNTRLDQQAGTHAEGQAEHGSPETRVDGQGTETSIIETATVGQSAKHTQLYEEEEHRPTLVEQAQNVVGQAQQIATSGVAAVASAVGLSGEEKKEETVAEGANEPKTHPADELKDHQVEELLRSQTMNNKPGHE